jgi:DNA processing protein
MPQSEEGPAWAALTRCPCLSPAALSRAFETVDGAAGLIAASDSLRARAGLSLPAREFLKSASAQATAAECVWLDGARHHLLPFSDPRFPKMLRAIPDCPIAVYVFGAAEALSDPQIAIVGSRNPTPQGKQTAHDFAHFLAARGLSITSGLAQGIDSAAHAGALAAQGCTLGVLGTGVDIVYPRANAALSDAIGKFGALVSEFPLGSPPKKCHFPQRNRLIAGLSLGTLVVEAARRSGSLITARFAGEQGREVFAVPGSIHNPLARGCHELIRQGANLTETADDILRALDFSAFFSAQRSRPGAPAEQANLEAGMDKDQKILLDALGFDSTDLDGLVVRTGFKPQAVSSMILILELEGHVQAAPGGRYSRVANRSRR